jgi:acyl-coenzyme A synthetase/AMP-(fatty) acid ligase
LPVSTAFGFRFLFYTLWRGGTFFFPGANFESTASAFEEYKVQAWLSSPGGLELLLKGYQRFPLLQSEIETVIVPGDVLPRMLANQIRSRICPHVMSVYGATETTSTASAPVHMLGDLPGAVGYLVPGVSLEIVSEAGEPLPRGTEGIIRIKSRYAVEAYLGDPVASAKTFRDGWFYPGDSGVLEAPCCASSGGRCRLITGRQGQSKQLNALAACAGCRCAAFRTPGDTGLDEIWSPSPGPNS